MYIVKAYTVFNVTTKWKVDSMDKAREYAKRMITEGLWYSEDGENEVFLPVHQVQKVKIYKK